MNFKIIFHDTRSDELKDLFKVGFRKHDKDLYFIDYSIKKSHVSFHKDNSVWLRLNIGGKPKCIIGRSKNVHNKISPFLSYVPQAYSAYPKTTKPNKDLRFMVSDDCVEFQKYLFVCCVISADGDMPIEKEVVDEINLSGLIKIGQKVTFNAIKLNGNTESGMIEYRPFIMGQHIFHIQVEKADRPLLNNVGIITLSRLFNESSIQSFLEAHRIPRFKAIRGPRALLTTYKEGSLDLAHIVFKT